MIRAPTLVILRVDYEIDLKDESHKELRRGDCEKACAGEGFSSSAMQRAELCFVAKLREASANNLKFAITEHSKAADPGEETDGLCFRPALHARFRARHDACPLYTRKRIRSANWLRFIITNPLLP
jgi:hypothetical protein